MAELKTYGDIKKLVKDIKLKKKGVEILTKTGEVALDQVLGLIPGASNVKTGIDFISTIFKKPDTKKTDTWLDKLDVDDQMLKIVDEKIENAFLEWITKDILNQDDNRELEDDFSMDTKFQKYLRKKYGRPFVAPIKEEFELKARFQKLAGIIK